ncbi:hypothetical protein [Streptomyces sp. NPDC001401]|uniref:SCO2400 family protein n=1 Tax=Streptomyces sp. NPDC001401 TaxID=3364570 RepID=UPI003682A22D
MDYCSSCRRHLNGALVCPGCGAYAPDIAPVTSHGRTTAAPAAMGLWPESAGIPDTDAYEGYDDLQAAGGDAESPASASTGLGRAARRRQRARWKKNQRKAVVATAVALVGGGLTVASMDRGPGHGNQASAATDLSSMGSGEQSVDTSADLPSTTPGTGKHRKPRADEASTTGSARQRSTTATAPHTDSAKTQQYTAPTPSSTPTTAAQQATKTVEDTTSKAADTATKTTQSPSSTSTAGTSSSSGSSNTSSGSSSNTSGSSDTSQSSSDTASTSPSGICVLGLLCVS